MGLGQLLGVTFRSKEKQQDPNRIKIPITNVVYGNGFPFIGDVLDLRNIPLATIDRVNEVHNHLYFKGIPLDRILEEDRKYLERAKSAILMVDMDPKDHKLSYSLQLLYVSTETRKIPVQIIHQSPYSRKDKEKPKF